MRLIPFQTESKPKLALLSLVSLAAKCCTALFSSHRPCLLPSHVILLRLLWSNLAPPRRGLIRRGHVRVIIDRRRLRIVLHAVGRSVISVVVLRLWESLGLGHKELCFAQPIANVSVLTKGIPTLWYRSKGRPLRILLFACQ